MNHTFGKTIKNARRCTGLTQERAAEKMNISVRTLAKYEQGTVLPDDAMAATMMRVFDNPCLGYTYLSEESEVGRQLLPKIRILPGAAAGALQYHIAFMDAEKMTISLERICQDDKISMQEEAEYTIIMKKIMELVGKGLSLYLSVRPGKSDKREKSIKKCPPIRKANK